MATDSPQVPSRRLRTATTRDRVLEVATELMARNGYSGTTISAISKASGVMPASIYWHFDSKEGLLAAVIERAAVAWFDGAAEVVGDDESDSLDEPDPTPGLRYIFEEQPDFYRVLMLIGLERGQAGGPPIEAVRRVRARLLGKLSERIAQRLAVAGLSGPHRAERLATFAMTVLDGLFIAQQIEPLAGEALLERYQLLATAMSALRDNLVGGEGELE